ncbi:hypothetical protein SKAU_G00073860 [Synaphobranchus kaupii]|uniref:Uncharacterized protein n=1 Tax=Synaphobranchus kaupii TaxID=118154 RepID=A0A9Q1G895_SYNKA|nr:hypothetical protein SKAU_G00073860 [Synaphobranchus kaupii]
MINIYCQTVRQKVKRPAADTGNGRGSPESQDPPYLIILKRERRHTRPVLPWRSAGAIGNGKGGRWGNSKRKQKKVVALILKQTAIKNAAGHLACQAVCRTALGWRGRPCGERPRGFGEWALRGLFLMRGGCSRASPAPQIRPAPSPPTTDRRGVAQREQEAGFTRGPWNVSSLPRSCDQPPDSARSLKPDD